jgi:hypothetical protein
MSTKMLKQDWQHLYRLLTTVLVIVIASFSGGVSAETIDGGVNMSETLPPVQPTLRAGADFNAANLPAAGTTAGWYWIPPWSGGTWHREMMTYIGPDGTGQTQLSRVDHFWGQQADNRQEIWQHHNEPYSEREDLPKWTEWKTVVLQDPVRLTAGEMQMHFRATTVQVNKKNGKINKTYQQEEMQFLRPEGAGKMYEESWMKFFDEMGRPLGKQHGIAHLTLTQPFQPVQIDPKTGLNLHQDFLAFLAANGYQYLIPGGPPANTNQQSAPYTNQQSAPYTNQQSAPYTNQPAPYTNQQSESYR